MITVILVISMFYLGYLAFQRIKTFMINILGFEGKVEEYEIRIKTTYCPKKLKEIYGELLDLHNQRAEFEYQKRNVQRLINVVHRRIEIS